jgi:hypothetical protein
MISLICFVPELIIDRMISLICFVPELLIDTMISLICFVPELVIESEVLGQNKTNQTDHSINQKFCDKTKKVKTN